MERERGLAQRVAIVEAEKRGLARRDAQVPTRSGADEAAYQKRHECVTVVIDHGTGQVVEVGQDRKQATFEAYLRTMTVEERAAITHVAMDMSKPFVNAVLALVPGGEKKTCFDEFHVASHLGDGVDRVRKSEHRALTAEGDTTLVKTKYLWLMNPDNMKRVRWKGFEALRNSSLKTARAWAIKENDEPMAIPIADMGGEGMEGVAQLGATQPT